MKIRSVLPVLLPVLLASCSAPAWTGISGFFGTGTGTGSDGSPALAASGSETATGTGFAERQTREEKVAEAKRRQNLRSIIRKGDYYSIKNDKEAALRYYETALARLGGKDRVVEQKIADVHYELKNFSGAYDFYRRLPLKEIDAVTRERFFFSFDFNESLQNRQQELQDMPFEQGEKDYHSHVGTCYSGIHNCVVRLLEYAGEEPRMKELVSVLKEYSGVSSDYQYRNALLAGTFFKQKQYLAAAKISEEIVASRPDYRAALKMAGFSRLELGHYDRANDYLKRYFSHDPKDVQTAYALGIVNYYLEDYATSNLYFNNAVMNGYRPKTELERRLVYNYYLLGDRKGTFKIFRYLLDEADVTREDFEIAVFTAIEEREYGKGFLWAEKGVAKFPDDDRLVAMRGWISEIRGDEDLAVKDYAKALDMNRRNSIALLRLGKLYLAKKEYTLAENYLGAAEETDPSGTFGEEAKDALAALPGLKAADAGSGTSLPTP